MELLISYSRVPKLLFLSPTTTSPVGLRSLEVLGQLGLTGIFSGRAGEFKIFERQEETSLLLMPSYLPLFS